MCNMLKLATICASHFAFLLLPTGSPLMKLSQFWTLLPSPGQTNWYLTAKSSLQHSIHIFRKSKKNQQLFLWAFFEEPHLYDRGGSASPPPHPIGLRNIKWTKDEKYCALGGKKSNSIRRSSSHEQQVLGGCYASILPAEIWFAKKWEILCAWWKEIRCNKKKLEPVQYASDSWRGKRGGGLLASSRPPKWS